MRRELSPTRVCAALIFMPANGATPFSYPFFVSVYAMRRETSGTTLPPYLKKRNRSPRTMPAMCRHTCQIHLFRTHISTCAKKTHGLSRKIQGTYFKISALYFKIYGLYFLPFQTPDTQQLIHFFQKPCYQLIFSRLRVFVYDCMILTKRCLIAIPKLRFRTSA